MHSQIKQMLESFLDKPAFSQSQLIKILLKHSEAISMSDREKFFDALLFYYQNHNSGFDDDNQNLDEKPKFLPERNPVKKDYRIKSIRASNFRGIPSQSDGVPYGIDFCIDDEPRSTILLGSNGSCKTSLFSGMEMIYTQKISEKILRTNNSLTEQDFKKYYERVPKVQEPQFDICSMDETITMNKPLTHENDENENRLDNYFISENDLITIGKLDFQDNKNGPNSFTSFIARSLGFSKIVEFYEFIMTVNKYKRLKESNEHGRLQNQEDALEDDLNKLQADIDKKNELLKSLEISNDQTLTNHSELTNKIKSFQTNRVPFFIDKEEVSSAQNRFRDLYIEFSNRDQIIIQKEMLDFLSLGMELLITSENCPFCGDSKKKKSEIIDDVTKYMNEIRDQSKLIEGLEVARKEIVDFWKKLDRAVSDLINMLKAEIDAIYEHENLFNLYDFEKSLIESISRELLTTEYWGQIKEIINAKFVYDKDSQIFRILSSEKEIIILRLIEKISDFITIRTEFFNTILSGMSGGEIIQQNIRIENEIGFLIKQHEKTKNDLKEKKIEKELARVKKENIKEIKNEIQGLEREMSKYIQVIVDEPFKKIEPIVLDVMSDYLSTPYSKVELKIEKQLGKRGKGEEQIEFFYFESYLKIKAEQDNHKVSPDKYFNSFRYKLFCLMLKIAITISYRVQNMQNYPLIVDDIFSSSDYENRNNFARFVKKVIELFEKYSKDLPLQLIIFTHDSLIFRSAMDAIYRMGSPYISNTKFGKLFVPEDRDKEVSIDSDKNQFWNLVRFINETSPVKAGAR